MSDDALAAALHRKYYSDIPPAEFAAKIGLNKAQEKPDPYGETAKADSNTDNLLASVGGAMYAPVLGVKQMLGKATPEDVKQWKDSMAGLWETPMGKAGTIAGGVATAAPLAMIPGANTTAGAALGGLAFGAAQPVGQDDSRLAQAIEGMGGGVAGQYAGRALGALASKYVGNKTANLSAQKVQNTVRDAAVKDAQGAGYVLPPDQIAPNLVNRALVGLSGKISTAQGAAIKNQEVTNTLARKALGIPEDVPLTKETLGQVRQVAGKAYEQLKSFGQFKADPEFGAAVKSASAEYRALADEFPELANGKIDSLLKMIDRPQFNSSTAVELVKRLRSDARSNLKAFDDPEKKALGRVQNSVQSAIEDLMDRNLTATGNGEFLDVFRNARTMIAKAHTVEDALEESTGKVVAGKIGKEYSKGRPLTGELATIGKTAQAFPKAVQNINTSMPGLSPLDYMGGLLTGGATGNPLGMAAAFARPIARAGILSGPYQKAMVQAPSYEVGLLGRGAKAGLDSEGFKRLLQSLGVLIPSEQQ